MRVAISGPTVEVLEVLAPSFAAAAHAFRARFDEAPWIIRPLPGPEDELVDQALEEAARCPDR